MIHKIFFSPGQHPHFMNLVFVDNYDELKSYWGNLPKMYPDSNILTEDMGEETGAFCAYNYLDAEDLGHLVFLEKGSPIIVHECVHAAISFFDHKVMGSSAVLEMGEDEQHDYYHEGLATTTEILFAQIDRIWNDLRGAKIKERQKQISLAL